MRRQDVNAKEAELDTLIQSHKSKLESLLKCRGKGDFISQLWHAILSPSMVEDKGIALCKNYQFEVAGACRSATA